MTDMPASLDSPKRSLLARLLSLRVAAQLGRNTVVSCGTFLFDLLLLWALVEWLDMDKVLAAALAFVVAVSIHYVFCRIWIFPGSDRAMASGYAYFLINALVGLVVTIALFWAFLAIGIHYLPGRVIASVFAGLAQFLLNAVLNFRSV
jgi:putative flippase GtrA